LEKEKDGEKKYRNKLEKVPTFGFRTFPYERYISALYK